MAVTFTYAETVPGLFNTIIATWTSDSNGDATGTSKPISGRIIKGTTDPSGTAAPTDNYDIVLTDADGINILANSVDDLVDRNTANNEEVYFPIEYGTNAGALYPVVNGAIVVTVSNAGDTKSGVLKIVWDSGGLR